MKYTGKHEKPKACIKLTRPKLSFLIAMIFTAGLLIGACLVDWAYRPAAKAIAIETEPPVQAVQVSTNDISRAITKSSQNAFIGQIEGFYDEEKGGKSPRQSCDICDATAARPTEQYSESDVMSVTNMVYGEISVILYDKNLSEDKKDLALQEWARVAVNHLGLGIADNLTDLMSAMSGRYYIWHPQYGTTWYRDQAVQTDADRYERCRQNVEKALEDRMDGEFPTNVIYADLAPHGSGAYKMYSIDTGYFRSTVYLSYQ